MSISSPSLLAFVPLPFTVSSFPSNFFLLLYLNLILIFFPFFNSPFLLPLPLSLPLPLLDRVAYVSIESTYWRSHSDRTPTPARTAHTPGQEGGHFTVHPATGVTHTLQALLHYNLVITISYAALHCTVIEMKPFSSLSLDHNSFFSSFHAIPILTHKRIHTHTHLH
jgi:hypothetical protein